MVNKVCNIILANFKHISYGIFVKLYTNFARPLIKYSTNVYIIHIMLI